MSALIRKHSHYFDTASLFYRAFYGVPTSLKTADGRPCNAVRGLIDFLARFISTYQPTHVACCLDNDWRPAWRVDLVPSYKTHRVHDGGGEETPDELAVQIPMIHDVLAALGIATFGADGFEADDVLATLVEHSDGPADVITGDRDLFQLVSDAESRRVLYVGTGVKKHEQVTDAWLRAKYGIEGRQYVAFATLRGDASDGLPGVRGIGEKKAALLLEQYGDLDGIIAAAPTLTPALRAAVQEQRDYLARAEAVVACRRDVALPDVDLTRPMQPRDPDRFDALVRELNLGGAATRIVDALALA